MDGRCRESDIREAEAIISDGSCRDDEKNND